jgi:hypothetical protein
MRTLRFISVSLLICFVLTEVQSEVLFKISYNEKIKSIKEHSLNVFQNTKETYDIQNSNNWKSNWKSCEIEHKKSPTLLQGIAKCKTTDGSSVQIICMKWSKASGLESADNTLAHLQLTNGVKNNEDYFMAISLVCTADPNF